MHSYDRRFNYFDGTSSRYTDSIADVLACAVTGDLRFVLEGHAYTIDHERCTEIVRVNDRRVDLGTMLGPMAS